MSREEVHIRDRLMMLAESTKPFNVKRKSLTSKQGHQGPSSSSGKGFAALGGGGGGGSGASGVGSGSIPKLSMQDFVRMDPGYTPDIEHLVFPGRKRNPQQVGPVSSSSSSAVGKTRSRLAEMFALSRHLQQRSADREREASKNRNQPINRSVDSMLEGPRLDNRRANSMDQQHQHQQKQQQQQQQKQGRWATIEEPVRPNRLSPSNDSDMTTTRGANVSILHLRSTSEPWETSPTASTSLFTTSRSYPSSSSTATSNRTSSLTKHESLGNSHKYNHHGRSDSYTNDIYLTSSSCNRELSPVRWCDKEVDGVYLGRSGWVQVQHRSLDEGRRRNLNSLRRTGMKLAEYQEPVRPVYLALNKFERDRTPSPPLQESGSPPSPSITPIISPPPAFQDRNKPRMFFGKAPFLPRSDAIVDSDASPPQSPPLMVWKNKASSLPPVINRKPKTTTPSPVSESGLQYRRMPQTKSLEDTSSSTRRSKFLQKHDSSSSSSQSQSSTTVQGFRSLDGYVQRCSAMPRLSENTDSSIDVYEDADDEDNNSSSLNISIKPVIINSNVREKISPSNRVYRTQIRRSPVGSDAKPTSPDSSSSSSNEFPSLRRRQYTLQEDVNSKVRRSRSLQLPESNRRNLPPPTTRVSPQHPEGYRVIKVSNPSNRRKLQKEPEMDEDTLREAEVVTGFLYGTRTRAAAQALLMHRYNNPQPISQPQVQEKVRLQRGSTTPNLNKNQCGGGEPHDFRAHSLRPSQSYPTHQHQRSLEEPGVAVKKKLGSRKNGEGGRRAPPNTPNNNNNSGVEVVERSRSPNVRKAVSEVREVREVIPTRPGSAPSNEDKSDFVDAQQRSMSLPKSFLSGQGGQFPWKRRGTESLGSSPGCRRRGATATTTTTTTTTATTTETSHTAPVTPLHDGSRRRSPVDGAARRAKAASTPQLIEPVEQENKKWKTESNREHTSNKEMRKSLSTSANATESVLQKFRKTFSLRFQKKGSKEEVEEILTEPTEEEPPHQILTKSPPSPLQPQKTNERSVDEQENHEPNKNITETNIITTAEPKHSRFGALIWRSSKERKKSRSIKCNSADSGIQIEMVPGGGGGGPAGLASGCGGGVGGDESSESSAHDTDPDPDGNGSNSANNSNSASPKVRRRPPAVKGPRVRPHSDLLNQILIDRFKADLRSRNSKHQLVRRTNSDLGGQRIYQWESASLRPLHSHSNPHSNSHSRPPSQSPSPQSHTQRRLMSSSPVRLRPSSRPQSPRKKPPDYAPGLVQLRTQPLYRRGQLRRSLSQPLDIDKLSPIMKPKPGLKLAVGGKTVSEDEHAHLGISDEEVMSDSESSMTSLSSDRKKSLELPMDEDIAILAEAVFDHVAIDSEELAFRAGDVIEVLDTLDREWWWGTTSGKSGWFPSDSVRLRVSQEDTVEDCLAAMASGSSAQSVVRRRTSVSLLSNDQVRTSVVRELVHTERDFVKILQDVAEGYLAECRKRKDMFTKDQLDTIFINLEDILAFQSTFLKDLESCIDWESPHKSCVGSTFIKHKNGFHAYSDYCNSHPMATAALQELYQFNNYSKFFEACRLMRGLIEIPLDGYLLTPVQRICKYPLQLAELLKYTKPEHKDYEELREALEAMKGVAVLINERKRRMESLEKIEAWQQRVEGWEGDDLIEVSSQLIHQGEVMRVTSGMWTSNITLFLFDHQLVYCKKDILKRNTYVYKGRICLDTSDVIDVADGKDPILGVNVRHAIRLYSVREKWLLVCCRSSSDKQKWLKAFVEERRIVEQEKSEGSLDFPTSSRHLAKMAARCQRRPPRKLTSDKNYKREAPYMGSTLQLNSTNSNSLGRRVGTWFTFGGNKKTRHRDLS